MANAQHTLNRNSEQIAIAMWVRQAPAIPTKWALESKILCAKTLRLCAMVFRAQKPFILMERKYSSTLRFIRCTQNWKLSVVSDAHRRYSVNAMASTPYKVFRSNFQQHWLRLFIGKCGSKQKKNMKSTHRTFCVRIDKAKWSDANDRWSQQWWWNLPLSMYGTASSTNRSNPHFGVILSSVAPSAHSHLHIHWFALYPLRRQQ